MIIVIIPGFSSFDGYSLRGMGVRNGKALLPIAGNINCIRNFAVNTVYNIGQNFFYRIVNDLSALPLRKVIKAETPAVPVSGHSGGIDFFPVR